jgi:carboxyl-terminal processing protease
MNLLRPAAAWSSLVLVSLAPLAQSQEAPQQRQVASADVRALTALWDTARQGDFDKLDAQLVKLDRANPINADKGISDAANLLSSHIAQREKDRTARITEVRADITKALETKPETDVSLAKALRSTIELHMLSIDKDAVLSEPSIKGMVSRSATAAHAAEQRGNVVSAGELFVLLDALLDVPGTYKEDVRRLLQRQEMLRLYAPELLYKQRQERQKAAGDDPLPEYNPFGDDWRSKLASIDASLIVRAIGKTRQHVEQRPVNTLLTGGLDAIKTMVTTKDLQEAFKSKDGAATTRLADEKARESMLAFIAREQADLAGRGERPGGGQLDQVQVEELVSRLSRQNDETVKIPAQALLHEFGNGLMSKLDEFSAIIWPDELRRFEKNTQGRFVGIGVQIEYDELFNIRVVTPLEGTPAQRAGIHPKDIIQKVDGRNVLGLSLDQAVEVITGPEGTSVTLTLQRELEQPGDQSATAPKPEGKSDVKPDAAKEPGKAGEEVKPAKSNKPKQEVEVKVTRSVITVPTVKGWKREGVREDSWDWFIDSDNHIGYVRLLQFSESTSRELDRAVSEMKRQGLSGLILDLRFNPGGLLDQAVKVSRKFIRVPDGPIVMTQIAGGMIEPPETTRPSMATLADVPLVVLINEGSASASEIVSGALETYAHQGALDAVVLGGRSYGKGSVQNVWPIGINASAAMKVTTAYYMLPDKRIIHRRPGALAWGVEPDLKVEMLPKQTADALNLRRNADVIPLDEHGAVKPVAEKAAPDPDDLITKGIDLQLETGLMLLRAKAVASAAGVEGRRPHASAVK